MTRESYRPNPELIGQIKNEADRQLIEKSLTAWAWVHGNRETGNDCFAVNRLHKSHIFRTGKKTEVTSVLNLLERLGVVSGFELLPSSGGRRPEVRTIAADWIADDPQDFSKLESKLFALLNQGETQMLDPVLPVTEQEIEAAPIVQATPEQAPPAPTVTSAPQLVPAAKPKFGPLRILQSRSIAYGQMPSGMQLQAGEIVFDELLCEVLLRDGFAVAKMDELGKIQCPTKGCHFTFDLSDESQKPPAHPILVCLREVRFVHNWVPIQLDRGAIVGEPSMVQSVLEQGLPQFTVAKPEEWAFCTKCKSYFGREHCLGDPKLYELQLAAQAKFDADAQAQAERVAKILAENPPSTLPTATPVPPKKKVPLATEFQMLSDGRAVC
jgi:hypothetical protein